MATEQFFTPSAGVQKLLAHTPALHFGGKTQRDWRLWRARFRRALMRRMGSFPPAAPMDVKRVGCVVMDGYRREKIVFNPDAFSTISAYVLVPQDIRRGERRPAVLCAHGHGSGKFSQVDPKDRVYKQVAVRLCRDAGFIVIAPDWRSFGERTDTRDFIQHWPGEHGADGCDLSYLLYG